MDIRTLMNRLDNIEQSSGIKKYISEGLYSTPEMQTHWKRIDENFMKGYDSYLAEVALTPDQIQNIFKQAGGGAGAEAPKDPGKLAAIVDKVMPSSQAAALGSSLPEPNAGPVQGFEQKAAAAVDALPGADSSTKQSLMQWIKQGVSKPETQQLILAAVGAGVGGLLSKVGPIISMIPGGGAVASAITGAIIAGAVSVASAKLQGKDWKTAFKGAIKPALMGGAAAVVGNLVTSGVSAMMAGGNKEADAAAGSSGQGSPEQQKAIADDQARMDSFQQKFPPGEGYTYQGQGDRLQVFDANGNKVFSGDIPFKSMDASTFAGLAQNGQNVATMTNVGTGAQSTDLGPGSEPRGAASGDMKPGDWNKMAGNKNSDGSPMTVDQINQAKADLRAGNASSVAAPAGGNQAAFDKEWAAANADQDAAQAQASGIQPRGGYGAQEKINAAMQAKVDADYAAKQAGGDAGGITARPSGLQPLNNLDGSERPGAADANAAVSNQGRLKMDQWRQDVGSPNAIGKNFDAGIAPIGANGQPMRAVPMDAPTVGQNFDAGIAPIGANGQPMRAVPMDEPATPQGLNRLTGRAHVDPTHWDQMTPDQQAATTAKQQQQAADAAQGTQNAKDYWANKPSNTRGLKESFAESIYVDKQATLKMWLEQDAKGITVHGLALKPAVKEGIMDSIKGMFSGGKKDAAAPAAGGGVTADALNKAWAAAGSPTDSEEVAKVLQGAGVPAETVNKVFADLKLPEPTGKVDPKMDPGAAGTPTDGGKPADATTPGAAPSDAKPETPSAAEKPDAATTPGATPADAEDPAGAAPAAGMKADDIVKALSTFWDQVRASQDSRSGAPAVQQQIKQMAKDAAMTGQVFESKYWNNK